MGYCVVNTEFLYFIIIFYYIVLTTQRPSGVDRLKILQYDIGPKPHY